MPPKAQRVVRFTQATLGRLEAPESGRAYWYDDEIPGLAFCITANGARSFYLIRRVGSRVERCCLGKYPQTSIEDARREAAGFNGAIATNGANPNAERRRERQAPTLQELFEEFVGLPTRGKRKRPRSARTVADYRWQFTKHLATWQARKVSEITRRDVEQLHARIGRESGGYMANRVLALIKAILNHGLDLEALGVNPARNVRPFEERDRDRFLQADELPRFWAALEASPHADFFRLALFTGARRGNVLAARWDQIDLRANVWRIPVTKSGHPLVVPLTPPAVELLKKRRKSIESEWVFPAPGGSGPMRPPRNEWDTIREAAGVADLRIHDLRRSLASWQASTGANLATIGKSLGHQSIEATKIYAHADLAAVRTSIETATTAILKAAKPKRRTAK